MMTLYMTPHHRMRRLQAGDQIARSADLESEVHVPVDIIDEKDAFMIVATLPGLTPEDVEIEIINNTVDIRGEFKSQAGEELVYLRSERPSGKFRRYMRFQSRLDASQAEARLEHGILSLRVPKAESELPKTIQVKVAK